MQCQQPQPEGARAVIVRRNRIPKPKPTLAELRDAFWTSPDHALLDRVTTAAGISRSVGWMELKAIRGGGIPYIKSGGKCLYRKSDALAWIEANGIRVSSTSELPPAQRRSSKKAA